MSQGNTEMEWMSMADPIHGMIRLKRHHPHHRMLLDVMNSRAFQRLRRIRQMGMAEFVFPGATHSRFVHSIGSAWLMVKTLEHLKEVPATRALLESEFEDTQCSLEQVLLLSILVHDIGHTPLSHTLEDILDLTAKDLIHDQYWNRLILFQDEELQGVWQKFGLQLPQAIFRFLGQEPGSTRHFLADLVSGQLDMDRLDYLLRDSHYLGVQYGRIEIERIYTNLSIQPLDNGQHVVAIREEAVPAVEHYLFGRYQAYKMAMHALDKASEALMQKTLERFKWCREQGVDTGHSADLLYQLITEGRALTVEDYLMLDDCYLWDKINMWGRYSNDPLLKQLANRLLGHDLLKYVELTPYTQNINDGRLSPVWEAMQHYYEKQGLSFEFGFGVQHMHEKPLYQTAPTKPPIWVHRRGRHPVDFQSVSSLSLRSLQGPNQRTLIFVWDKAAKNELSQLLKQHFSHMK